MDLVFPTPPHGAPNNEGVKCLQCQKFEMPKILEQNPTNHYRRPTPLTPSATPHALCDPPHPTIHFLPS